VYWYQKAAEQGLAEAQYNLGFMYVNGKGVLKDYKQAVYWCSMFF
jgi:TPR repeat protein